jgi:adenylate cyclase
MSAPSLAVLFVDIVGSTELYGRLGDVAARATIGNGLALMLAETERCGGAVIKTIGDEIMAVFTDANAALDAVAAMQAAFSDGDVMTPAGGMLAIRAGCDFGPVLREQADIYGTTVNIASRMTQQAKAGQVLATAQVMAAVRDEWRRAMRQIDLAALRGLREQVAVFEVIWQDEDVTSMPLRQWEATAAVATRRLLLRHRELAVVVDAGTPLVTLGRSEDNDLVVDGLLTSRLHARIELYRGHFRLVDQSTNGSFVIMETGEERRVRRDTLPLGGAGVIGLGQREHPVRQPRSSSWKRPEPGPGRPCID